MAGLKWDAERADSDTGFGGGMTQDDLIELMAIGIANNSDDSVCDWEWCVPDNRNTYLNYAWAALEAIESAGLLVVMPYTRNVGMTPK